MTDSIEELRTENAALRAMLKARQPQTRHVLLVPLSPSRLAIYDCGADPVRSEVEIPPRGLVVWLEGANECVQVTPTKTSAWFGISYRPDRVGFEVRHFSRLDVSVDGAVVDALQFVLPSSSAVTTKPIGGDHD
jgi:hypothetical protein